MMRMKTATRRSLTQLFNTTSCSSMLYNKYLSLSFLSHSKKECLSRQSAFFSTALLARGEQTQMLNENLMSFSSLYNTYREKSKVFNKSYNWSFLRKYLHFDVARRIYPHPSKIERDGEDASFCGPCYIGVADGVGSWIEVGVDPGLYSRELLYRVQQELGLNVDFQELGRYHAPMLKKLIVPNPNESEDVNKQFKISSEMTSKKPKNLDPVDVLETAFSKTRSPGSRPSLGRIVWRSRTLQHEHNFPFQLGPMSKDRPSDAHVSEFFVEKGDWIVVATDGLWDNLYDLQVTEQLRSSATCSEAARKLGELAVSLSLDDHWDSPFCDKEKQYQIAEASNNLNGNRKSFQSNDGQEESTDAKLQRARENGLSPRIARAISNIRGGKLDDISIIVARLQ